MKRLQGGKCASRSRQKPNHQKGLLTERTIGIIVRELSKLNREIDTETIEIARSNHITSDTSAISTTVEFGHVSGGRIITDGSGIAQLAGDDRLSEVQAEAEKKEEDRGKHVACTENCSDG